MAQLRQLPRFILTGCWARARRPARACINGCLRSARLLHPFYADKDEIAALIAGSAADCGRDVPFATKSRKRWRTRRRARGSQGRSRSGGGSSAWPEPNAEQIEAFVAASDVARARGSVGGVARAV